MNEICFRCKQPVCLSGWNNEIDGFYENVAPAAASGGQMMPMHWKCSAFKGFYGAQFSFQEIAK